MDPDPTPHLHLALQTASRTTGQPTPTQFRRWAKASLTVPTAVTIRLVDSREGHKLNQLFRHKDYATNVLTFDYAQTPVVMADLVLCAEVVAAEAAAQGKTLQAHYAHLLVHGTLHAQGYDHETNEGDALEMETLEILLLAALGFDCPY